MNRQPTIRKASGETETFDPEKLIRSLKNAGNTEQQAKEVLDSLLPKVEEGMSTRTIYRMAFSKLRQQKTANAARYCLKNAIMALGPSGYPFEQFIGQVLASQGFDIKVGEVLQGKCITHEVDVVATQNNTQYLVECKFYNSPGKFANVRVPLYVRSRVDDIIAFREKLPQYAGTRFFGWVVTNTRFTEDAMVYGRCAGLHMLGWDIPKKHALKEMIEEARIFPVTTLTGLNTKQKKHLLDQQIVLCRQLNQKRGILDQLGLTKSNRKKLEAEMEDLCT